MVTDLERGVTARSVPLPEPIGYRLGALALTPDESALAVLSVSGVAFASTSGGQPTGCPPPPAVAGLTAVCGELGDVLTVGGKAYVTNVTFNRVEVMSLADGKLEAPILVGSRPRGLDVSADGRLLYVALSGAEEVSVVDMTEQRELRRITVPSAVAHTDRPSAVAVTSSGIALVTTQSAGMSSGVINQIDLGTEIPSRRRDFDTYGFVNSHMPLARSADRERVLAVGRNSDGQVSAYRSDTDSFGPPQRLSAYLAFAALDGTGQRGLLDNGMVLDAGLRVLGDVPGAGRGVAVNRAGTMGYRVRELEVEVIDLSKASVVRTLPLPQPVGAARGAIALSADERSLAVLTGSGVSLLSVDPASVRAPYAVWAQPASTPLDGTGTWVAIAAEPKAEPGQLSASYMFASYFIFANSGVVGAVALVTQPAGKFAVFTVAEVGGPSRVAVVPFQWRAGGSYFLFVHQIAAGRWAAYAYGPDAAGPVLIGTLSVPAGWGQLSPVTVTVSSWIGDPGRTCGAYPLADVMYHPPIGFAGSGHTTANRALTDQTAGACAGRSSVELGVWDRHRLGNGA